MIHHINLLKKKKKSFPLVTNAKLQKGGNSSKGSGEATHAVLCPLLGSPVEERCEHTENSPKKDHKHDQRTGASLLGGKTEGTGTSHFGEEKP